MKKGLIYLLLIICLQVSKANAHTPPIPEFSTTSLCFGDSTRFTNQSIGGVYSMWVIQKWDVSLNDTITIDTLYTTDLTYLFSLQGIYYITLQEDNGHIVSITKEVLIGNNTNASFDFQRCTNQFINMSTCSSTFLWNFGDGNTSTLPLPTHQYADTGIYLVTLISYNGLLSDTITKQIVINELGYANPIYQVTLSNDTVYCKITGGIYNVNTLTWFFGDGTSVSSADTFHVFQDTGMYSVTIRVFNSCGMFFRDTMITVNYYATSLKTLNNSISNFLIYPNPAQHIISIKSKSIEDVIGIEIFDLVGQRKFELFEANNYNNIDVSFLNTGQYFLRIRTRNGSYYVNNFSILSQ